MLPKPMRYLDAEEAKWFIKLDQTPITQEEMEEAKKSTKIFHSIKPKK